ncbi:MAG TPA: hypothetical protein VIS99_15870, partial [Terrimicrobiaceae bacterium]
MIYSPESRYGDIRRNSLWAIVLDGKTNYGAPAGLVSGEEDGTLEDGEASGSGVTSGEGLGWRPSGVGEEDGEGVGVADGVGVGVGVGVGHGGTMFSQVWSSGMVPPISSSNCLHFS